ncbi:XisI protein [uncultured Thiothrix sp.]|uniref:XisI protein n=1 Tax=uncultured Thiothrix sp. TaxID=223185 RepID=UPI002601DC4A|nr:XisI protein [uncultured Thiothrix sp.]
MEKLELYRSYIKQILEHYAQFKPAYGDLNMQLIFDEVRDSYQLMTIGWLGYDRYHGSVLHVEIKNGLIWIQHDGTEGGIANELVELGVPKSDIVLAFHAPYKRKFTGFATGLEANPPHSPFIKGEAESGTLNSLP